MDTLVAYKSGGPAKALATAGAPVRAGACVSPLVHCEVGTVTVAFPTDVALERFLA